jgi:uncharacterized membrane protein
VSAARRVAVALVVAASGACAFFAHRAISQGESSATAALVALVPVAVVLLAIGRRMRHPLAVLLIMVAAGLAAWWGWSDLEHHVADVFFVEHAGIMLALALLFGRTLRRGREPLCTRFARIVHGTLEPRVSTYTRKITVAWTAFFVAMCAASCILFLSGQREAWSLLANILTPVLIPLLFVVEYAVRRWALPHHDSGGILAGVRAFRRHMAGSHAPR